MFVAEARWLRASDHAAMAWIVARYAQRHGLTLERAIERRVWRYSRPPRWTRALNATCAQPRGWPRRLSWAAHADECRELYARAQRFLRGELGDPCRGKALGWRRPGRALQVALARGRTVVYCSGDTANTFVA